MTGPLPPVLHFPLHYNNIIHLKTFEELGIAEPVLRAIREMGYEAPMPVQEEVIPLLLGEHLDIIALAQTGTGKTAAYGLPILQKIDIARRQPQVLILCPTRELCLQIAGDLSDYSRYVDGLHVLPVYGGSSIESQIKTLRKGVHVVVATPGRLLDLLNRKTVDLGGVRDVVLDEADEMLDMGFTDSIDAILAEVPEDRHMLLFSATMPQEITRITRKYMKEPREVVIGRRNEGNQNIRHVYYMVHARDKYAALKRIADYYPGIYGIVFCRTRKETQEIADRLIQGGYNADSLHGELSQAQRDYVMQKFRLRNLNMLVATDVAARGLDVDDLTHVIHFGLPDDNESYNHRSGRTARAGKTGISISICHVREKSKIRLIEKAIGKKFERAQLPSGEAICEKQLFHYVDRLEKVKVDEAEIERLMPAVFRRLEWLEKEDIIKRLLSLEFNRMLDYYRDAEVIEDVDDARPERREKGDKKERADRRAAKRESRGNDTGFRRLRLNFGKDDGLYPAQVIDLINRCVPGRKVEIGRIEIGRDSSYFEVERDAARRVADSMNSYEVDGRPISVSPMHDDDADGDRGDRKPYRRKASAPRSYGGGKPWRRTPDRKRSRR